MPETLSFCVPAEADGERLDKWLSGQESLAMTRSALQVRMEHGDVTVNGKKSSEKLSAKSRGSSFGAAAGTRAAGIAAGKYPAGYCL